MEEILLMILVIAAAIGCMYLIITYWYIVIPVVIIIGIIIYICCKEADRNEAERNVEEAKRRAEEKRRQAEKRKQDIMKTGFFNIEYRGNISQGVNDTFALLDEITKYPFIIDTNIWLGYSEFKCFWEHLAYCCVKNHRQVMIPVEVYDEIINLAKGSKDSDTRYNARQAKNLLFELDNKKLLSVYNLGHTRNKASYADPVLIRVCKAIIAAGHDCYLFTNDKDLIIRTRQLINRDAERCKVLSVHTTEYSYCENEFFIPIEEK